MEKIDLTKCNNCRFRAKVDGKEVVGKIEKPKTSILLTGDNIFGCVVSPTEMDNLLRGVDLTTEDGNFYITDFEIVPRDPETYKDWQVGDSIKYSDNYSTGRIIFRSGDFVAADIGGTCNCYTCDELFNEEYRLVLTDIEQQIIEERKKYEPQDGDICFVRTAAGNCFIFIKRSGEDEDEMYKYASIDTNIQYLFPAGVKCVCRKEDIRELRPATEDEKQKLFDAMSKEGKRWNAEKKVVEDIPKPYEFRKGEPVLVRDSGGFWKIAVFTKIQDSYCKYMATTNGVNESGYIQCIPYNERTMHLLGTTQDYKEGE